MLVLYDEYEEEFETLGIGVLTDFKNVPTITEVLKGEYILEFEYLKKGKYSEYLNKRNIIKALGQPFRIEDIKPSKAGYKILARHIVFDLRDNYLIDVSPTNKTAQEAVNWILQKAYFETKFTAIGDCTNIASARYVRLNLNEALWDADNSIINRFGGEPEYDKYNIIMHNMRGSNRNIEIREKKNLNGFEMDIDYSGVKTKIQPVGNDGLVLPEIFIDSPLINNYPTPKIGKIDVDVSVDDKTTEAEAYQIMRSEVQNQFNEGLDKPKVSLKVNFIELSKTEEYKQYQSLETIYLGDTLKFYMPSINQNINIRVIKTVKNALNGRILSLELGNEIPNIVTQQKRNNAALKTEITANALNQAKIDATNLINHPFNGHLLVSKETGELYIMDTTSIATAVHVWKWGLGGLGFSSHGIEGPYDTAWTQDGGFVANFITSGTMSVERIEGLSELLIQMQEIENLVQHQTFINRAVLENCKEGILSKLSISGEFSLLFPSRTLYPSSSLYLKSSYLKIEYEDNTSVKIKLPVSRLRKLGDISDELIIKPDHTYLIKRIDVDNQGNLYELQDEIIIEYDPISLPLKDGTNTLYLPSFQNSNLTLDCTYVCQSVLTDVFTLRTEVIAMIQLLKDEINLSVEQKTDTDELIAKINLKPGKINMEGLVTANENFKILPDGSMEAVNGNFKGNIFLKNGNKVIGGDGLLTNLTFQTVGKYQNYDWLGFQPLSQVTTGNEIYGHSDLELDFNVPDNFTIISAFITLYHTRAHWATYNQQTYQTEERIGSAKNLKLYKTTANANYSFYMSYGGEYDFGDRNITLTEIENAFNEPSYTPLNTSSDTVEQKTTVDISSHIRIGNNKLVIRSNDSVPSNPTTCSEKTGMAKAVINIIGYMSFSADEEV